MERFEVWLVRLDPTIKDGRLLRLAEKAFDGFVTGDNLPFQQHLPNSKTARMAKLSHFSGAARARRPPLANQPDALHLRFRAFA